MEDRITQSTVTSVRNVERADYPTQIPIGGSSSRPRPHTFQHSPEDFTILFTHSQTLRSALTLRRDSYSELESMKGHALSLAKFRNMTLASTCHTFEYLALDGVLWRNRQSVEPLVGCLPSDLFGLESR